MSFDKPSEEYLYRKNHSQRPVNQKEVQSITSDPRSTVTNVYHGYLSKKCDKVSQTENCASRSYIIFDNSQFPEENQKKLTPKNPGKTNPGHYQGKVIQTSTKERQNLMSNDRKDDRSTEPRKHHLCDLKLSKKTKARTELERMKLQAELKATEEIAKLKQTIIEKRLALELATIQNKVEYPSETQCSAPTAELRGLEDLVKKKESLMEATLVQELQECQTRPPSGRLPSTPPCPSPRPPPSPPSPSRHNNPFRTESTSSVLTNLRGLNILDKKFASDKPYSVKPPPINIFDNKYTDNRPKQSDWYQKYYDHQSERDSPYAASPGVAYGGGQSAWKSAVAKIKKKMKNKPGNPWEE